MKMKHIIALCLVLSLVLPSTALAATSPKAVIHASSSTGKVPLTVKFTYTVTGGTQKSHTWFMPTFQCSCTSRTYTFTKAGTYTIKLVVHMKDGKTLNAYKTITVKKK